MADLQWIDDQVATIEKVKGDDEAAHSFQDDLFEAVLRQIADGKIKDTALAAKKALKVLDIEFSRWCA